jgi:hypothetical protein
MVTALSRYWQRSLLTPIDRRHGPPYHRRGREPVAGNTGAATWEARSNGAARGGTQSGEESVRVTENERRAADSLRASDLVLRGIGVVGLIAVALVLLLVLYPT